MNKGLYFFHTDQVRFHTDSSNNFIIIHSSMSATVYGSVNFPFSTSPPPSPLIFASHFGGTLMRKSGMGDDSSYLSEKYF